MFYFHKNSHLDAAEKSVFVKQDILNNFIGENRRKSRHQLLTKQQITRYIDSHFPTFFILSGVLQLHNLKGFRRKQFVCSCPA